MPAIQLTHWIDTVLHHERRSGDYIWEAYQLIAAMPETRLVTCSVLMHEPLGVDGLRLSGTSGQHALAVPSADQRAAFSRQFEERFCDAQRKTMADWYVDRWIDDVLQYERRSNDFIWEAYELIAAMPEPASVFCKLFTHEPCGVDGLRLSGDFDQYVLTVANADQRAMFLKRFEQRFCNTELETMDAWYVHSCRIYSTPLHEWD